MKNLLVVVDMVNGFVNFGNLSDKSINRIVPNIVKLMSSAKNENTQIVAFKDTHTPNDPEFKNYPPHCIAGTDECELVPELLHFESEMAIIEKPTTNGFLTKKFNEIITQNRFDEIAVCGCCTDICVANFLESLSEYLKKTNNKTRLVVYADAVDTFNADGHKADEINQKYLEMFGKKYNAEIKFVETQTNFKTNYLEKNNE